MKLQIPSISLPNLNLPGGLGQRASAGSIGLDIGFHSIKAVELVPSASGFELVNFAIREIPKSVLEVKDRSGLIADIIKEMFAEKKILNKNVYLSVSGHNVIIRRTALPKMPKEELIEAAKWNAKEEALFSLEGAAVDCFAMGEVEKEGALYDDLLAVIVRADIIPFMISIVEKAGLKPLGVTVTPIALWDYDRAISPVPPETVTSYVDMGAERTRVYFVADNRLLFSREIPNGGKNVTGALAGEYATGKGTATVDEVRAEVIKKTHGLPPENADGETQEGIPLLEIRERILPVLVKQMEELHRSLEYFKNQYKKDNVHRMILSGGAVGLSGLYKLFSENLGVGIERCNVFMQGKTRLADVADKEVKLLGPSLTAAAGLAVGRCEKINVLPEEYRGSLKKTLIQLAPWSLIPVFILALLIVSVSLRGNIRSQNEKIKAQDAELVQSQQKALDSQAPGKKLAQLKQEKGDLEKELSLLPGMSGNHVDIPELLRELARLAPPNVSFSEVDYAAGDRETGDEKDKDKGKEKEKSGKAGDNKESESSAASQWKVVVQGNIFGDEETVLATLTNLLEEMKRSPAFKEVKLNNSETMDKDLYTQSGIKFEFITVPAFRKEVDL